MLYILYINFDDRIKEYVLPGDCSGLFILDISEIAGKKCSLQLDCSDETWRVRSNDFTVVENSDENGIVLEDMMTLGAYIKKTPIKFAILVRTYSSENWTFGKYFLKDKTVIGSSIGSDIMISEELISHRHFYLEKKGRRFQLTDQSLNGTWINGKRVKKGESVDLNRFDSIYIPGTTIIFLGGVCALRKGLNAQISLEKADYAFSKKAAEYPDKEEVFSTKQLDLPVPVVLELPENSKRTENIRKDDPMKILMTSLISSSVLTAAYSFSKNEKIKNAELGMLFVVLSAALSASMLLFSRLYQRKNGEKIQNRYSADRMQTLRFKENKISETQNMYREYLWSRYHTIEDIFSLISSKSSEIWNIKSDEDDFLKICIGKSYDDFKVMMVLPENSDNDLTDLYDRYSKISDVPVLLNLKKEKVIGLYGSQNSTAGLLRSIIIRTAFSFSSNAARILLFSAETQRDSFDFTRWLPHVFQGITSQRLTAYGDKSHKNVLFYLVNELSARLEKLKENKNMIFEPHLVIFCSDDEIFKNEAVQKYLNLEEDLGATFIIIYSDRSKIPHNCRIRISCDDGIVVRNTGRSEKTQAELENISANKAEWFSRQLLGINDSFLRNGTLPDELSFYEMHGVSSSDEFDILENYRNFSTAEGLEACIGVRSSGEKFILDLHEKKHGPHGLVAGTTGSGKSEMLRTMVLSLAIKYTPDELNFVFIDYKGGGMADIFENLCHTAGIVTNLTDSLENGINLARRAVISLKSEITRRQKIFKEKKISSADTYIRLFKEGKVKEPLPHIIIIVDEFAELRSEQPEFISQLISISRIGRSLGMHLILATQKPAGVVDDEIWSNARFRLCLKVQDKTDSIEMLRRPEAQNLTAAGRAYVQIGNNEIFDMIQTGYTGAPDIQRTGQRAVMIDDEGQPALVRTFAGSVKNESQLSVMLRKITDVCENNKIRPAGKLWLPPLKRIIEYSTIREIAIDDTSKDIVLTAGLIDDPENQKEMPWKLALSETGNILTAGDSGSGKTTFIQTLIFSAADCCGPEGLMISIFDFSGGLYEVFGKLPHCRDIYSCVDDFVMRRFFDDVQREITVRKQHFSSLGASDFTEYLEMEHRFKAWIVFLDGFYNFKASSDGMEEIFSNIVRECTKYGIYFVVSVRQLADMKFRTRQNFRTCIPFRMSDRTEYTEIFGAGTEYDISKIPGRAPVKIAGRILEFQSAVCFFGTGREKNDYLSEIFEKKYSMMDKHQQKEEDFSINENIFCTLYRPDERSIFEKQICDKADKNEVIWLWSAKKNALSEKCSKSYFESQGIFELLLDLKNEFMKRLEEKRTSGICLAEKIIVYIDGFEDFLKRVYDKNSEEGMSSSTEMYFQKGNGLNIYFKAFDRSENSYSQKKAFRYFISYTSGE